LSAGLPHEECKGLRVLAEISLPCIKNLWSAQNRFEWEREYKAQLDTLKQNRLRHLNVGDLLRLGSMYDEEVSANGKSLEYWLGRVDGCGTLVMAAASLPDMEELESIEADALSDVGRAGQETGLATRLH
jgi:hypothetical protein